MIHLFALPITTFLKALVKKGKAIKMADLSVWLLVSTTDGPNISGSKKRRKKGLRNG